MIAPDGKTLAYLAGRRACRHGRCLGRAVEAWGALRSDPGAAFDQESRSMRAPFSLRSPGAPAPA